METIKTEYQLIYYKLLPGSDTSGSLIFGKYYSTLPKARSKAMVLLKQPDIAGVTVAERLARK